MLQKLFHTCMILASLALPATSLTVQNAQPKVITVTAVNNSGKPMTAIYLSSPEQQSWGQNKLKVPAIGDRASANFSPELRDGKSSEFDCFFDVSAEYSDGKSTRLYAVNLCQTPALNFN
ncbi:MAG: hypothetical protein HC849_19955 [Oscillatoriales cyanobacterium RU_3_3]|nr:hypothetical protein [Oscillatoriales cyanobacterium RU_3_3]NJR21133.1 hypothetical protein [Richelia sp. CSU_2_1]